MSACTLWPPWPGACRPAPAPTPAWHAHAPRHTLRPRELTIASASSFIIVVAVAFVGILLLCAASSFRHHRRTLRALDAASAPWAHAGTPTAPPRLWDIYLHGLPQRVRGADVEWEEVLPLAAVADVEAAAASEDVDTPQKKAVLQERRESRAAGWFRPWRSRRAREQQSVDASPAASPARPHTPDIGAVEVALFIAMPVPHVFGGEECAGPWAECAVGTSKIPYRRAGDESVVAAAS